MKFNEWLIQEKKDIFGFESETREKPRDDDDDPVARLNTEDLVKELLQHNVGNKTPRWYWSDVVIWSNEQDVESLQIDLSPAGSSKIMVRKKTKDLTGDEIWICKEVLVLSDEADANNEINIAYNLLERLTQLDDIMDSPNREFNLERLALRLANKIRHKHPTIMTYDRLKKIDNGTFLIVLNYKGSGVGSPDGQRLEQFHIYIQFDPRRGVIRTWGCEISSPMRVHRWISQPSEFDEGFVPSQDLEEIERSIVNCLMSY